MVSGHLLLHQHTRAARARKSANVVSANMVSAVLTFATEGFQHNMIYYAIT